MGVIMVMLAFYKGNGTWVDRLIRRWTRGPFPHVELITRLYVAGPTDVHQCISASARDGGVRSKRIQFKPGNWQILDCPWSADQVSKQRAVTQIGKKYDYVGLIFSQALNLRRHSQKTWFCSELIGHAIALKEPHRLSPSDLYLRCIELNDAYALGRSVGKLAQLSEATNG